MSSESTNDSLFLPVVDGVWIALGVENFLRFTIGGALRSGFVTYQHGNRRIESDVPVADVVADAKGGQVWCVLGRQ